MLGKFIARDFIAIAGEMHRYAASNENTGQTNFFLLNLCHFTMLLYFFFLF
jgi:hypothetical protein